MWAAEGVDAEGVEGGVEREDMIYHKIIQF
jgi:hypothetical protein